MVLSLFAGAAAAQAAIAAPNIDSYMYDSIRKIYGGYSQLGTLPPKFMNWPALVGGTKGSYACPAPGQVCGIQEPLNKGFPEAGHGPMFFAGEHAAADFTGFMEGALQSGVRAAARIATAQKTT